MGGGKVAAQGTKKNRFLSDFDEILPRSLRTTLPPLTSKLSPTTTTTNTTTKNSCFRNARRNEKLQAGNTRVLCFSGKTTFASGFAILCFHFCCFFFAILLSKYVVQPHDGDSNAIFRFFPLSSYSSRKIVWQKCENYST